MKIVNRQEFYKLPNGTLYSDYEPVVFSGLKIKGDIIFNKGAPFDFNYTDLIETTDLNQQYLEGKEFVIDFYGEQRDGSFDESDLYAVYNGHEIIALAKKIGSCIGVN